MDEKRLKELIKEKRYVTIKKELEKMNPVDVAELLESLDVQTALLIFRTLPKDLAVEVFAHFSVEQQRELVSLVTDKELKHIVDELYFDDMIDILEEVPANVVKKILLNAKEEERNLINQFLRYPPESAGSIMTIEYVDLKKNMTVKEALEHIKETGLDKETVYTCYVTDANRKLEGIVSLRKLVISDEDLLIEDIMERDVIYVHTHDDQETVARVFKRYGFLALPVVDNEGRLIGIITVDDIMEVIDQEATEDFQKMAAMSPTEEKYLEANVFSLAKHRVIWLLVLMISATFTGGIIRKFENLLQSAVVLTAFIPMLMDTGGNAGSQSSTLVIRGIALGEIAPKDTGKVVLKELVISIIVGVILAVVNFFRIYLFDNVGFLISFTVSITLFVTVVISKVIGGILPMIAKKLNIDPAIMAGPLITTIVDALSLIVYFSIASCLLNI
ncbi:magnesium transporter [Keratinibaculum paraultunense]|uniref:Magnesium transporter MgtE n=1 Tax=Keratinibaculum paraultunense TaxID=1278232 RepID=A0A4V6NZ45_9FIRM|nr:magnesium transporter [Keratinibaculum paraultunense]QQY79893.1 magnesium transporter [Keratinibaculum paraultunense]TCS88783.1 magnesium transporter [Keratinibaculum paraultunense]